MAGLQRQLHTNSGVIFPLFTLPLLGTKGDQGNGGVTQTCGNRVRIILSLVFTKQRHFIAIILFIDQLAAQLRPGR